MIINFLRADATMYRNFSFLFVLPMKILKKTSEVVYFNKIAELQDSSVFTVYITWDIRMTLMYVLTIQPHGHTVPL